MFRKDPASAHASYFFDGGRVTRLAVTNINPDDALRTSAAVRIDLEGRTTGVCLYLDPKDARKLLVRLEDWYSASRAKAGDPITGLVLETQDATLDGAEIESDYQRSDNE